jgi:hypothetical protein
VKPSRVDCREPRHNSGLLIGRLHNEPHAVILTEDFAGKHGSSSAFAWWTEHNPQLSEREPDDGCDLPPSIRIHAENARAVIRATASVHHEFLCRLILAAGFLCRGGFLCKAPATLPIQTQDRSNERCH